VPVPPAIGGPDDLPLISAIAQIVDWVSADRSEKGDADSASSASQSDAWFAVHVVEALIPRMV
jgi:hypothetical protein